jgi:uncharacterized protein (DUF433 family)
METAMNYRERIVRDPNIAGGEPVVKGTRVTLRTLPASLAEGRVADQAVKIKPDETTARSGKRRGSLAAF